MHYCISLFICRFIIYLAVLFIWLFILFIIIAFIHLLFIAAAFAGCGIYWRRRCRFALLPFAVIIIIIIYLPPFYYLFIYYLHLPSIALPPYYYYCNYYYSPYCCCCAGLLAAGYLLAGCCCCCRCCCHFAVHLYLPPPHICCWCRSRLIHHPSGTIHTDIPAPAPDYPSSIPTGTVPPRGQACQFFFRLLAAGCQAGRRQSGIGFGIRPGQVRSGQLPATSYRTTTRTRTRNWTPGSGAFGHRQQLFLAGYPGRPAPRPAGQAPSGRPSCRCPPPAPPAHARPGWLASTTASLTGSPFATTAAGRRHRRRCCCIRLRRAQAAGWVRSSCRAGPLPLQLLLSGCRSRRCSCRCCCCIAAVSPCRICCYYIYYYYRRCGWLPPLLAGAAALQQLHLSYCRSIAALHA